MKKKTFTSLCVFMGLLSSCAPSNEPEPASLRIAVSEEPMDTTVVIHFSDMTFEQTSMNPVTRAAITDVATRLDIWITDGDKITEVHQQSSDTGFGNVALTLNKLKTYTLYATAHKCEAPATLTDGIIAWTDDKIKDTFFYSTTFSPATATTLNCAMRRIVAQFRLTITDAIPTAFKKLHFKLAGVYDRWDVSTGATHQLDREATISYGGTSAIFNVYAIVTDTQTTHTVTAEALDASDKVIQSRTFTDVPLRNGYRTIYSGAFFTDQALTMTFTATDWQEYDTVNF